MRAVPLVSAVPRVGLIRGPDCRLMTVAIQYPQLQGGEDPGREEGRG